jgi:dTDP-4-dehydrorhamnose reductase
MGAKQSSLEVMANIRITRGEKRMKHLILGANGLIGREFVKNCKEKGIDYVGTCYSRPTGQMRTVDFLKPERLAGELDEISPTAVIDCVNLAGGVNFCEENPDLARKLHLDATKALVDWCANSGAFFVFFSTDYVFDGENPPYREDDKTGPLNLYGKLKLESEHYIKEKLERYLIIRTTNVYGWDPETVTPNFLMYIYQTLEEGKSFRAPSFLYGNPTYAGDLVKAVMELMENNHHGLFHIVGEGYINRFDWAIKFCRMAGLDGGKIEKVETPPANIVPRPFRSNLNTGKVRPLIKTRLHNVDEGLRLFVEEMKK